MPGAACDYDYEEGKRRIIRWLSARRAIDWSPTPELRRLESLIKELESITARLEEPHWLSLEEAYEADPPREMNHKGVMVDTGLSNHGRFSALKRGLRELAQTARQEIEQLPGARQRLEVPRAAELFLHLRHHCGIPPPVIYESGDFVIDFGELCKGAGVHLSLQRLTNILSQVLRDFDLFLPPPDLDQILVPKVD